MNASRLAPGGYSLLAEIAKIGWDRNSIPIEIVSSIAFFVFLPRSIVENANTPFPYRKVVLFLAGNHTRLAPRAVFVVDKKSISIHLVHQLSEFLPNQVHIRVVANIQGNDTTVHVLVGGSIANFVVVVIRD